MNFLIIEINYLIAEQINIKHDKFLMFGENKCKYITPKEPVCLILTWSYFVY